MRGVTASLAAVAAAFVAAPVGATDLHRLWDERCAQCHGHAAEFARAQLSIQEGRLQGSRPSRDLRAFLVRHGELEAAEADGLHAMLSAQLRRAPLFRKNCAICHDTAADLARDLILRDSRLYGRYSGRRIDQFLQGHGRIPPEDLADWVATLTRIEAEVHAP